MMLALTLVLASRSVVSAETPTLEEGAAAIEQAASRADGERVVVGHISRKLGIPGEELRTQHAQTGRGWGELLIANRLAALTGRTFDELVAERASGRGWTEIADRYGADLPALLKYVQQSEDAIEQRSEDKGPATTTADTPTTRSGSGGGRHRH
jgi:hypothetical protein